MSLFSSKEIFKDGSEVEVFIATVVSTVNLFAVCFQISLCLQASELAKKSEISFSCCIMVSLGNEIPLYICY